MIIYIAAGILTAAFLTLSYLIYLRLFHRPPKLYEQEDRIEETDQTRPYREAILSKMELLRSLPWETMTTTSQDGLTLYGRYYHQRDGAPLHICFHSHRGTPFRDCCGFGSYYLSLGHNLLLVESRARFRSEGTAITYGIRERLDCVSWVNACREKFGPEVPLVLSGISMGATAILLASNLDLDENVKGIVADCAFLSTASVLRRYAMEMSLPNLVAFPCVWFAAIFFAHMPYHRRSVIRSVKKTRVPILLFHGTEDRFAPCSMASKIQEANLQMVSFYPFSGAGHCMSYFSDPKRYEEILHGYLNSILPETKEKQAAN